MNPQVERYRGDPRPAGQIISDEKKAGINREFPGQWIDATFDEIDRAATAGEKSAKKARKLLTKSEYDKNGDA